MGTAVVPLGVLFLSVFYLSPPRVKSLARTDSLPFRSVAQEPLIV